MTKTTLLFLTLFLSIMTNGQGTTFDKKVQQLFFDVDVSIQLPPLVDSFTTITGLTYKKPKNGIHRLTGIDWKHTFSFTHHPYLTNHFDTGLIEIKMIEQNNIRSVYDISWTLQFNKLEDAKRVFEKLKKDFSQANTLSKIYTSELALETAEFTNEGAKKYPYVMFMLFNNDGPEKQYKLIFSLDNDMHYEK